MANDEKPKRLKIQWENIPVSLSKHDAWVLWKWEKRKGKWTKPPYQVTGKAAKSTDPATWGSYGNVFQEYKSGKWDGIGFVLGNGFSGFDFDDIRNPSTGEIQPDWLNTMKFLDSYCEVSPSGTGTKHLLRRSSQRVATMLNILVYFHRGVIFV